MGGRFSKPVEQVPVPLLPEEDEAKIKTVLEKQFKDKPDNNFCIKSCPKLWIQILRRRHKKPQNIYSFEISQSELEDDEFDQILALKMSGVTYLRLAQNNLTYLSVQKIIKMPLKNLTQLNLSNNPIGDRGARLISKMLVPSLLVLTLGQCEISDTGLQTLSKSVFLRKYFIFTFIQNHIEFPGIQRYLTHSVTKHQIFDFKIYDKVQIAHPVSVMHSAALFGKIPYFSAISPINKDIRNILVKGMDKYKVYEG